MATLEKLMKAFEILKVHPNTFVDDGQTLKKKDVPVNKKDKITQCSMIADAICSQNLRSVSDFPKYLGIAMETFLSFCDDEDSDIRMVADECLNKTIKSLLESHLGRLQVELYKEIKKETSARRLRAALSRFADLCHLIRPQKCRAYTVNLIPCLTKICHYKEESVQETLSIAIGKIMPILGKFTNDGEIKMLLKAFLPNLSSESAVTRRTSATSLVMISHHSRKPLVSYVWLLSALLDHLIPVNRDHPVYLILGVLLCIRHLIPHLSEKSAQPTVVLRGSIGVTMKEEEVNVHDDQLIQVYELLLHYTRHQDHNVITASLEALQQLFKTTPQPLLTILLSPEGIQRSYIYSSDSLVASRLRADSQILPTPSTDDEEATLDDEPFSVDLNTNSQTEENLANSCETLPITDSGVPSEDLPHDSRSCASFDGDDMSDYSSNVGQNLDGRWSPFTSPGVHLKIGLRKVPQQLKSANSEEKLLEMDDSQDIVSAASSPGMNAVFRVGNIGSFTERNVPLCYCARLLSSSFLLSGGNGGLMPDRNVRVSIKSLAVSCLAGILNLYPKAFFLDLDASVTDQFLIQERAQKVWDVMHYTQHHDPHLRGHTALLLGSLLKYGLREAGGSWEKWAKTLTSSIDTPTLETILMSLLEVSQDESSVATRLGLSALKLCLKTILSLAPAYMGLKLLEVLLSLKDNPYWLVKVELMELVCEVPFAVVNQMQNSIQSHHHHYHYRDQNTQMTGHLQPRTPSYQDRFLNEVLTHLLSDEDFRVRQAAANSIVKVIPFLFFAIDHAHHDPVVAIARQEMDKFLNLSLFDQSSRSGPLVHGLVKPFDLQCIPAANTEVQGALSRVLSQLVNLLYTSTNKFLTFGCCHTLCELSNEYPPTLYTQAWCYVLGEGTSSIKNTSKGSTQTPELEPLQESDLLFHLLVLVTSTPIALDLLSHQHILHLIGNIFSGSCYSKIQAQVKTSEGSIEESKWTISKDPSLSKVVEKLLGHLIRLLNMFTLVIEEQVPIHQTKSSLPSLPNTPNLSPMKRNKSKSKDDQTSGTLHGPSLSSFKGSPHRQTSHDHKNSESIEKDRVLGSAKNFILQPLYVKLYDLLKATHSSYKISMDFGSVDKFRGLLKVTLDVLSQILEVSTLEEMGSHAEELLTYSKSVMSMEACSAIKCVRQLLKCLFGTNLLSLWEEPQNNSKTTGAGRKPGRATRLSTSLSNASASQAPGLYHTCFTSPYTLFTQAITTSSLKINTLNTDVDLGSWLSWMRKRSERKLANTLKGGNKSDVSSLAAHIRLFEPVVIKALKLYTIASSVNLQCEVLHILAQLVQLRVNYCLLDSDEIFINFVIKQFEYIEEGQILQLDRLIPSIFCFLVLLSYERYHSKSIISVSKIIQLCDGLIASEIPPQLCAIPALRPIVEDLFLLRGSNKLDLGKELDAQREVIVSVLLRFVQYPEVLDMFLLILHQCFKEGEDRWKKLSRLVVDTVLPFLARQQIQLDNQNALDTLHQLFEAVAPSVFRPVDILLKVLFATPQDLRNVNNLQRWMCLVLSLLRVLLVQAKEEVALSRLGDLGLPMTIPKYSAKLLEPVLPLPIPIFTDPLHGNPYGNPEYTIARFLFQVVGVLVEAIHSHTFSPLLRHQDHVFLCQQMSHLLLYLMHMFQSGIFRKVTNSAMNIIKPESSKIDIELPPNGVQNFYSIEEINQVFLDIAFLYPTLVLQWSNILILLNYENQGYWIQILRTVVRRPSPSSPSPKYLCEKLSQTPNSYSLEVVRRGGLILMCDYVCENLNDAEQMTWLIINHVSDLVQFSREPPVQDFISAIHRNSAASGLFVQAIQARCEDISKPSFLQRTLKCLEAIHLSQSGTLLTLIVDKFLCSHNLSLSRSYGQLACRRLQMLLDEIARDPNQQQLPLEDIEKLLDLLSEPSIHNRHIDLVSLLKQLRAAVSGVSASASLDFETSDKDTELLGVKINREWFLEEVRSQCFKSGTSLKECALLLSKLTYEDAMAIMNLKGFHLPILQQCLLLGAKQITIRDSRLLPSASNSELVSPTLPEGANPHDPETPLYSATKTTLLRHITLIIEAVPRPHQVFLLRNDTSTPRESKYRAKLTELFQDSFFWDNLFQVADSVATYLLTLRKMPGHWEVPVDNLEDVARLGILCSEAVLWMLESKQKASCENIYTSLNTLDLILKNSSLAAVIGLRENMTWSCTAIAALYNFVLHCKQDLSNVKFPAGKDNGTNQEHIKAQLACTQMAQLIRWLEQAVNEGATLAIPSFIMTRIRNLIAGLSRINFVNSFARTPPILWQLGWQPDISGEFKTIIPPPPGEFLQERDVLMQYIYRVNLLGWTSRQQFEETWMSLLTVLSATPLADHEVEDEDQERILASCMAVKSITALLLHTLLLPQTGNPHSSVFLRQPRDKPLAFLHTRCGKKLQVVRTPLHLKILELLGLRDDMPVLGSNTEKVASRVSYSMGQVSLEYLCVAASLLEELVDHESSSSSSSSPSHGGASILGGAASYHQREQSLAASGLDIHSCLHFLLDLYSQWLSTQSCSRTPLVLLTEVARSVVMLSDIFMERIQYEWMLDTLLELHRIHPAEDEVIAQYLMYGICKAAAVLNMDQEMLEKLKKIVDLSLKSTYLPTRIATLYGLLYLLEQGGGDESYPLLSTAMDYLNVHLDHSNFFFRASSANEDHILIMWALAFYIIENYQDRIADNDFGQKMFQLSLNVCSGSEESVPTSVYLAVFHGLERLLVADLLNAKEAEMVVKLSVDRIKQSSPPRALAALGVLFSCMYIGKGASGLKSSDTNQNIAGQDDLTPTTDPEQLIAAMERVTAIFDRVKRGLPFESEVIIQVLPSFLMEFFPAQDVLNKVIGEFVSSQQPYPQLLSGVLYQVFEHLHHKHQEELIHDWVLLSLSNFAQRSPLSMAVWSLTCCFVSASNNPLCRSMFPHIQNRMGLMETRDKKLFCLAGLEFRNQLTSKEQKASFKATIATVSHFGSPYTDLLALL